MSLIVNGAFIFDVIKLTIYVAFGYLAFNLYARWAETPWLLTLANKRVAVLALLTLLVVAIKVFEDVIAKESGPIDIALLWLVRQIMPPALLSFFSLVTLTGAAKFLVPATAGLSVLFFLTRHRSQAVLLVATMTSAWVLTYAVKALVNRSRPELWSTTWYWGSSFPSGHTLSTAAFATALVIGTAQIWPKSHYFSLPVALIWIGLMGLSRLVLGVHWPTDVLVAICLGIFIPLAISLVLDVRQLRLTTQSEDQ